MADAISRKQDRAWWKKGNLSSKIPPDVFCFFLCRAQRGWSTALPRPTSETDDKRKPRVAVSPLARRLPSWLPCLTCPEMWSCQSRPNWIFWVEAFVSKSGAAVCNLIAASSTHKVCPFDGGQKPRPPRDLEIGHIVGTKSWPWPSRSYSLEIFGARLWSLSQMIRIEYRPKHIITCAQSTHHRKHAERRRRYTRASCLLTDPHLCEPDYSKAPNA